MKKLILILQLLTAASLLAEVPKFSSNAVILVKDKGKTYCFSPKKYSIVKKSKPERNLNQKNVAKNTDNDNNTISIFITGPLAEIGKVQGYEDLSYPDVGFMYGYKLNHITPFIGATLGGHGLLGASKNF